MTELSDLAADLIAAAPPVHHLALAFPDTHVDVRSNDRAVLDALAAYYREFLRVAPAPPPHDRLEILALAEVLPEHTLDLIPKPPDPGKPLKEAFIDLQDGRLVGKQRTGVALLMGEAHEIIAGPLAANIDQVINFINHRVMQRWAQRGACLAHAAAVARGARGLALAGRSGAGKSTLALHLLAADPQLAFVSNDRLLLRQGPHGPELRGIPKHPRVNPGTVLHNPALAPLLDDQERARYHAMPIDQLWALEEKRDAVIDRLFGPGRFVLAAHTAALLLLNWRRGAGPARIRAIDLPGHPELLPLLRKELGLFFWPLTSPSSEAADAALLAALRGAPVYLAEGGVDFPAAVAFCRDLLRE
ncbi:MAG: HprK-related kinase B [Nannocystis sp.]|nr:HprK-related kinase B [Nannocystis sp.]